MNINANILINNITTIQSLKPNDDIFCVVKANAYGHGLEEIVQILDTTNCAMIVVDNLPEYQRAKRFTSKPILMIGATHPLNYRHLHSKQAIFGVISLPILETLAQLRRPVRVHLFINTGMNREGLDRQHIRAVKDILTLNPQIDVQGVMSHCSDGDNAHITNDQIIRFKEWTHAVFGHQLPRYRHLGASDGLLTINDPYFNARRPGLICYGYAGDPTLPIKPIMEIWSTIVSTHEIKPGEGVSYTKSWRATHPSRIGTIPFGYDEGLIRSLSNKYFFSSKKKNLIPQVGNICMNNASIDITDTDLTIGDTICVIGPHQDLRDLATVAQTNVYELLTSIKPGLKKIIIW